MSINTGSRYENKMRSIANLPGALGEAVVRAGGDIGSHAVIGTMNATREAVHGVLGAATHVVHGTVGVATNTVGSAVVNTVGGAIEGGKAIGSATLGLVATPAHFLVDEIKEAWGDAKKGPMEAFVAPLRMGIVAPAKGVWGGVKAGGNWLKKSWTHTVWRPVRSTVGLAKNTVVGVAQHAWEGSKLLLKAPIKAAVALSVGLFSALSAPVHHGGEYVHKVRQELPAYKSPGESYQYNQFTVKPVGGGGGFIKRFSVKK